MTRNRKPYAGILLLFFVPVTPTPAAFGWWYATGFPGFDILRLPAKRRAGLNGRPHILRRVQPSGVDDAFFKHAGQERHFAFAELEKGFQTLAAFRRHRVDPALLPAIGIKICSRQAGDQLGGKVLPVATDHVHGCSSPVEAAGGRADHQGAKLDFRPVQVGHGDDAVGVKQIARRAPRDQGTAIAWVSPSAADGIGRTPKSGVRKR